MEEKILAKGVQKNSLLVCMLPAIVSAILFILYDLWVFSYSENFGYAFGGGNGANIAFWPILVLLIILGFVWYSRIGKCQITVSDKRVYGIVAGGKRVDLPFDHISAVGQTGKLFDGIIVTSSSGRIAFYFMKNRDEVFDAISKQLIERQNNVVNTRVTEIKKDETSSEVENLKKYKDLLDSGIITQEEFDAKKKQILG